MKSQRPGHHWGLAGGTVLGLAVLLLLVARVAAQSADPPQRIGFHILTGSTSGTYFRVGELLTGLLSHPPGISRCETANLCGPAGLIVSSRATQGSIANVLAVQSGAADSGLAQADVVALAVAGQGPFRRSGPARDLRTIANLYGEDLHLVAARSAKILSVADLRGKRVSLSTEGSGTIVTARAVLAAYRLPEWRIRPNYENADRAAALMREGRLDAFFFVGGTPVNLITQLLEDDVAVLIPIDGPGRTRLLQEQKQLGAHVIPQGTYPGTPGVETISMAALWVTHASKPDALVNGMIRALYNPRNRPMIEARRSGFNFLELSSAAKDAIAPLHPGAMRYYTEARVMPPPPGAAAQRR
jgi:TRAP transporter TAXI family solute receptor